MRSESSLDNDSVPMLNLDQLPPTFRSKWTCARPKDEYELAYESVKAILPTQKPRFYPDAVHLAESLSDFVPETTATGKGWARIGSSLGDCVVGRGAYGTVRRMRFQKNVYAVKSIAKSVTDIRLPLHAKEILAQTEINHTNVARLHRVFEDEGSLHLVMEYCAGGNLYQCMKRTRHRRFNERTTFIRFMQLVSGLTAIHAAGFHHRDLKLENLLLDSNGVLKITDFGWVSPVLGNKKHFSFCGTLDYLPPEMLQGAGHDWRMDIWATGVLLYEMLVGRTAFNSTKHGTLISKVFSVQTNDYPPDIPQDFKDAVSSLLVYNEDRRLRLHDVFNLKWVQRMVAQFHQDALRSFSTLSEGRHQSQTRVPLLNLGGIRPDKSPISLLSPKENLPAGLTRREGKKLSESDSDDITTSPARVQRLHSRRARIIPEATKKHLAFDGLFRYYEPDVNTRKIAARGRIGKNSSQVVCGTRGCSALRR